MNILFYLYLLFIFYNDNWFVIKTSAFYAGKDRDRGSKETGFGFYWCPNSIAKRKRPFACLFLTVQKNPLETTYRQKQAESFRGNMDESFC
jgi:hypothetical protein